MGTEGRFGVVGFGRDTGFIIGGMLHCDTVLRYKRLYYYSRYTYASAVCAVGIQGWSAVIVRAQCGIMPYGARGGPM